MLCFLNLFSDLTIESSGATTSDVIISNELEKVGSLICCFQFTATRLRRLSAVDRWKSLTSSSWAPFSFLSKVKTSLG